MHKIFKNFTLFNLKQNHILKKFIQLVDDKTFKKDIKKKLKLIKEIYS